MVDRYTEIEDGVVRLGTEARALRAAVADARDVIEEIAEWRCEYLIACPDDGRVEWCGPCRARRWLAAYGGQI